MIADVSPQNFQVAVQVTMPLFRKFIWIFLAAALGVTGAAATLALAPARAIARPQRHSAVTL
ncbi:MAG: hypothetical protein ACRD4H_09015, partial [Candidatus Acidiferrales bacterium]